MTNQLKKPIYTSTFSTEPESFKCESNISVNIPEFDDGDIIEQVFEVDNDFLYVAVNVITWYQALEGRMSDAEIAMFQPVLERILLMLKKMNGTV